MESFSIKISFQLLSLGCPHLYSRNVYTASQDLTHTVNVQILNYNSSICLKSWLVKKSHSNSNLVYHTSFPSERLMRDLPHIKHWTVNNISLEKGICLDVIQSQDMFWSLSGLHWHDWTSCYHDWRYGLAAIMQERRSSGWPYFIHKDKTYPFKVCSDLIRELFESVSCQSQLSHPVNPL